MTALEEFYLELDESDWDAKQEGEINIALLKVSETLMKEGLSEAQHFAAVDRQVFQFNGSPNRIRSYQPNGNGKKNDFDHLYKRFKETKNVYVKSEYGLVFYNSKKEHDIKFVIELLNALVTLIKSYIDKLKPVEDSNSYLISYLKPLIANTLTIAHTHSNKGKHEIDELYKSLTQYLYETHQHWDTTHHSAIVIMMIFTDFAIEYFNDFNSYVDLKKAINKNWETAKYLSEKDAKEPIYIIDPTLQLCKKLSIDDKSWKNFKAQQYEKITAVLLSRNNNMIAISYIEKALKIYKELKEDENITRLEKQYQQMRHNTELNDVAFDIPKEESERINKLIKKEVQDQNEEGIINTLLLTPMLLPLAKIKEENEHNLQSSSLFNIFHTVIYDKFGNVIDQVNDNDKERFSLNWAYGFYMQIALQSITHFFLEAYRADKISANGIINYLKNTWIGSDFIRKMYGKEITISHLKLIESGINAFFKELQQSKNDSQYLPDLISATDSLILKAEYLLREFCYFLEIPTFKPKNHGIVMEKLLDEILDNLEKKLSDDDHFFIKYTLTKTGYNLRNKIAHGLMDNIEYSFGYTLLAIIIILKLSRYEFVKR